MTQLKEAATLRNKILAAWRDMLLVLADRTIPDSVRKELEDVRLVFRQTWADMESAAQDEAKAAESAEGLAEAEWDTAYVNDLPDSCFAVILSGGEKDANGKTVPRSNRKLPYRKSTGAIDLPHLRNALSRLPQMKGVPQEKRDAARSKLLAAAKKELPSYQEAAYLHKGPMAQVLSEAGDVGNLGKHLASKYSTAHLFSDCMKDEATQGYDAEKRAAVCARAHYEVVGKWPSQKESQEGTVDDKEKKLIEQAGILPAGVSAHTHMLTEQTPGEQPAPPAPGEVPPPPEEQSKPEDEVLKAFIKAFEPGKRKYTYWVSAVSTDPQSPFGAAVLVQKEETGDVFAVTFLKGADGKYAFSGEDEWVPVEVEYRKPGTDVATEPKGPDEMPSEPTAPLPEPAAAPAPGGTPMAQSAEQQTMNLAESVTGAEILSEGIVPNDGQGPLTMRVKLIEPGWGNSKDKHYYSREVLARDAHVFDGTMMFESDHKNDKSTRNWVSTVRKVVGFTSTGAPIAEVVVHDPGFAQRVRNLKTAGLLEQLPCSILATGQVKAGKIEDKDASIVEAITAAESVDWVTRAGAGGKALELAEAASRPLDTATVQARLAELHLHSQVKERLISRTYHTLQEIDDAAKAEVSYVKRVTGSGAAVGLGESGAPQGGRTPAEHEKALEELDVKFGLKR